MLNLKTLEPQTNIAYPECERLPADLSAEAQRRRKSERQRQAVLPFVSRSEP